MYLYEEIVKHIAYKQDVNDNIIFYRTDIIFQVPFYIPTPISLMVFFFDVFLQTNDSPLTFKSTQKGLCLHSNEVTFIVMILLTLNLRNEYMAFIL